MRLTELMESIPNRPRNFDLFARNRIRELDSLIKKAEEARELTERFRDAGDRMLYQWISYHRDADTAHDAAYGLPWLSRTLERRVPLQTLRDNLESVQKYGVNFLQYIFSAYDYVERITDKERRAFAALDVADQGALDYGYDPDDPQSLDEEYHAAKHLLRALRLFREVVTEGERIGRYILEKLTPIRDIKAAGYADRYRPQHAEIETLYHATAYADEIVRDGFHAEKPIGWRGLGNFGEQRGISFTHDLAIARDAMRALKEMAMIAKGELTSRHILDWIDREGIELKQIQNLFGHGIEINAHMPIPRTAYLYRYYLALSKQRNDPVFTYPEEMVEALRDRPIRDIGVIAAKVRLTPQDEYLVGESEFRVPPDRVQSIRRIM